jgi:hypothetical protein
MVNFMIKTSHHRQKNKPWLCLAFLVIGFAPAAGCAKENIVQNSTKSIESLIEKLRQSKSFDQAAVEDAIGRKLVPASENSSFSFFEAKDIPFGEQTISLVDYRSPVSTSATAGPLLNLTLAGSCLKKSAIEARYGPLSVTNAPRGRSLDEELGLSRVEPWGTLSFGFAERNPDCLSSITFSVGERGAL